MRKIITCLIVPLVTMCVMGKDFQHELSSRVKPWTNENFLNSPEEFHFAVVPDRTGGERPGYFKKAIKSLNLLRPEFVMSVGDLVDWGGAKDAEAQWKEEKSLVGSLDMPFFHVVGNHDIVTGFNGMSPARQKSIELWKGNCGTNTYYSFKYKGCLFVCFDAMETCDYFPPREVLSERQIAWALEVIEKNKDVRWRFFFMHKPLDWTSDRWLDFERKISRYDYTVFCGDWHNHCTAVRHGKKYYMIGTAGGCLDCGCTGDDLRYGCLDSVTWVTMTVDKGPIVSTLALSGIYGDTIQTCEKTAGWIEAPLDYPSHRAENPAMYADEKNCALVPTEVMHGPGYDWHFRHAVILRQGRVYADGLEKFKQEKRVVLLGDETASDKMGDFGKEWQIFDFGFKGDKVENVLWRVIEGELLGYDPQKIVVSVGRHNRATNTKEEIVSGLHKLEAYVRDRCPLAEIKMFVEL